PVQADASGCLVLATAPGNGPALARLDGGAPRNPVALTLEAGWRVTIQAMSEEDAPLAGAKISLTPMDLCASAVRDFSDALILNGTTASDGRLEFRDVAEGSYALHVAALGLKSTTVLPLVVRPDRRSFRVRLQEGYSLRGDLSIPEGAKASP